MSVCDMPYCTHTQYTHQISSVCLILANLEVLPFINSPALPTCFHPNSSKTFWHLSFMSYLHTQGTLRQRLFKIRQKIYIQTQVWVTDVCVRDPPLRPRLLLVLFALPKYVASPHLFNSYANDAVGFYVAGALKPCTSVLDAKRYNFCV